MYSLEITGIYLVGGAASARCEQRGTVALGITPSNFCSSWLYQVTILSIIFFILPSNAYVPTQNQTWTFHLHVQVSSIRRRKPRENKMCERTATIFKTNIKTQGTTVDVKIFKRTWYCCKPNSFCQVPTVYLNPYLELHSRLTFGD